MNKVVAFALRRKNSILSMSEKMFCPPQPLRFWITPACAGKRRSDWIIRSIYWDHPRLCGEKDKAAEKAQHLRGKGSETQRRAIRAGITPAYAGKRTKPAWNWLRARDHPRVCGEKKIAGKTHALASGSPPPVRGKGRISRFGFYHKGITPARAGKRIKLRKRHSICGDHPRVCGEKAVGLDHQVDILGSPPRMRGKGLWKNKKRRPATVQSN